MAEVIFQGERYRDDRMFVVHLCKCTVEQSPDGVVVTTIYHEEPPPDNSWCVATYRNTTRYQMFRVDHFRTSSEAERYIAQIEPQTPLVSLGGRSPRSPLPYKDFVAWKTINGLKEYDYESMFAQGGSNAREVVMSRRR